MRTDAMVSRNPHCWLPAIALLAAIHTAHAQSCFPGRPLPDCRSFPVFEIGYAHRLDKTPTSTGGNPQVHYLNGEVGWMVNRSDRIALGGTLFAGALVDYAFEFRPGAKARIRYWVGRTTGLDLGAGVVLGKVRSDASFESTERHRLGGAGHVGVSFRDVYLLILHAEYLPNPADRDFTGYLGARIGSKPAMWTALIAGPLLGLGALVFSN